MPNPLGKRYGLKEAFEYLQIPEYRLRTLVARREITFVRETPRGPISFFQQDLDEYLERSRTIATPEAPRPQVRSVDDDVRRLIRESGFKPVGATH